MKFTNFIAGFLGLGAAAATVSYIETAKNG